MKLHVDVTAEDIAAGVRNHPNSCPIALAMCRLADVDAAAVDDMISIYAPNGERLSAIIPLSASHFICDFDDGNAVAPFSFDIEVEPPVDDDDSDDASEDAVDGAEVSR